MTPAQQAQLRRALHDLAAGHQHLQLAAHLTVHGRYTVAELDAAADAASKRFARAMELARKALGGDAEVFSLAIVANGEIEEVS
jgi:hypothetical protein